MMFIDHCTRFFYEYFLKLKDEALDCFKIYNAKI